MNIKKKDIRKMEHVTTAEFEKLKAEYEMVVKNMYPMSNTTLILLCIVGVAILFSFRDGFFLFIGFFLFVYAFYTFSNRIGHREGYFDGYAEGSLRKRDTTSDIARENVTHPFASEGVHPNTHKGDVERGGRSAESIK